ncbi:MAG: alpha/beta hydrolase [Bacteroidota bacterium]
MKNPSIYKSKQGRVAILSWYDQRVESLDVEVESHYVGTRFGRAHLLSAGPTDAPPVILLHGMNMNGACWGHAMRQLSADFRVYAVDIIGMPGKSAGTRPARKGDGYPHWLQEVMEQLQLDNVHLMGESFGGWIILQLAQLQPERIKSAVLLGSGGLVPFTIKGQMIAGLTALRHMIWPTQSSRIKAVRPFYAPNQPMDDAIVDLLSMAYRHVKLDVDTSGLPVIELANEGRLNFPLFISYGAHDLFFDASTATQKAGDLFTGPVTKEIVSDEGHLFSPQGEQMRMQRVLQFLNEYSS